MGALGAIITAIIQGLANGLNAWLAARQAHADAVTLGERNQQLADNRSLIAAANAQTAAAVNAPKTVEAVEGALDAGKF